MKNNNTIKELRCEKCMKEIIDKKNKNCLRYLKQQKEDIIKILQPHLDYCRKQNGLPHCKNCGLSSETFKKINNL